MRENPKTKTENGLEADPSLARLFREFALIASCVIGGGYAILMVADDVFGRKLKWLRPGELLERLPLFQMVPGLIAGNTAMYVGFKTAGRVGAAVGLFAVALPSFVVFLGISSGCSWLPVEEPHVAGALLGLRAAMTGILAGTLLRGWRRSVSGWFGYAVALASAAVLVFGAVNPALVLVCAMCVGVVARFCAKGRADAVEASGIREPETSPRRRVASRVLFAAFFVAAAGLFFTAYGVFVKFGLLCFGGGFPLVPLYAHAFVGESAPLLRLPLEAFSNFIALTQATPGPVSVNAATFFGYRMGGVCGAALATVGLLAPSYLLMTSALAGLEKWSRSRFVQGVLYGVRPATSALLVSAGVTFASMSVWNAADGWRFSFFACMVALGVSGCVLRGRTPVVGLVLAGAILGAVFSP